MRKDLNYLNTNCRMYDMYFNEMEFMNQTKYKLVWNTIPTILDVPNPPQPLKSKRKVSTDRKLIQETGPAVMVINIYKY